MFGEIVGLGERWLEDHHPGQMADPTAYAALLAAMELGALVLREQLSRALGADIFSPEGHLRLARAKLDFYSKPLLSPELAEKGHAALDELQDSSGATDDHGRRNRVTMAEAEPAIRARGLSKRYGQVTALAGLDLDLAPGEVVGYLGPNGAGKTTTIRLLLGFIRPTAGRAEIFGADCQRTRTLCTGEWRLCPRRPACGRR